MKTSQFWEDLLTKLKSPSQTDVMRLCNLVDPTKPVDFDRFDEKVEDHFLLADKKLHVFPFEDVSACWHRLYTDTSVMKAVGLIRQGPAQQQTSSSWFDQVVSLLDMAMIMSGGFGRREEINDIYDKLEEILKLSEAPEQIAQVQETEDSFSTETHSVPKLRHPIETRLNKPTLSAFERCMHELREPVVLLETLDHWPARRRWHSKNYWQSITLNGRRLVPIEIGRSYVDEDWGQKIMQFGRFLQDFVVDEKTQKGYLAQFDLFAHLPHIEKDVATPDYCFLDTPAPPAGMSTAKHKMKTGLKAEILENDEVQKNIWFGPPWTISPLHHDPHHNVLCQVVGKKYVRLFSPETSSKLYPRASNEPAPQGEGTIDMSNTSSIDVAAMELSPDEDWDDIWPGIGEVPYLEVILEAGEALYIPEGWWHYIRSCSIGISVSFWWSSKAPTSSPSADGS